MLTKYSAYSARLQPCMPRMCWYCANAWQTAFNTAASQCYQQNLPADRFPCADLTNTQSLHQSAACSCCMGHLASGRENRSKDAASTSAMSSEPASSKLPSMSRSSGGGSMGSLWIGSVNKGALSAVDSVLTEC